MSQTIDTAPRRMTPEQLSLALTTLSITGKDFAFLTGTGYSTVKRWFKAELEIPHWVPVMCAVLTLPGALDLAESAADAMAQA
jgi:hypothetical protein